MSIRAKSLIAAYIILFLDNFGFAIIFPIFPILLLNPLFHFLSPDVSEAGRNLYLGLLLGAFPLAQFFGTPFFGDISDRFGRKKALVWTLVGCTIGYILTALGILMRNYSFTIIARLITGFFAGNLSICMAIITDLNTAKKQRSHSLSYVSSCLGVSWILAIIVGSIFIDPKKLQFLHPSFPFWLVAACYLISLALLYFLYYETAPKQHNHGLNLLKGLHYIIHVLEHKQLRALYLMLFFWFFGFYISLQWVTPLAIEKFHIHTEKILWFLVLLGIFWSFSSTFLNPRLINHMSLWKITLWTLFFTSLLYFFGAVANFFLYFAGAYILSGVFAAASWGNSMSLISLAATSEAQGKSLGIAQSVLAFAQFLGPLFGGLLAGFSIETLFYACSILVFISFLLLFVFVLQRKGNSIN